MRKKFIDLAEGNEYDLLKEQLDDNDLYVLGYLRSFDRKRMQVWHENGLYD